MAPARSGLLKWLGGIVAGLVVAVVGFWLVREIFGQTQPSPGGTITTPGQAEVVPADYDATGSLSDIPDDEHVWLAARRDDTLWPIGGEIPNAPSWQRGIPSHLPRGKSLSLVLFLIDDKGNDLLQARAGRARSIAAGELEGLDALAAVPTFFVRVEVRGPRLYAVFPQARSSGGHVFRYENAGGKVEAAFPDDPRCHRPSRAAGLRVRWRMSGRQSGGWGVAWDRSTAGRFDASRFGRLSLTTRGSAGGETFEIGLKDRAGEEQKVPSETAVEVSADEWRTLSLWLRDFEGVDLGSLENVSIGFGQSHGSGGICIDEIVFEGTGPGAGAPLKVPEETPAGVETDQLPRADPRG